MKHFSKIVLFGSIVFGWMNVCGASKPEYTDFEGKPVVYQVFTRLFGNQNTNNKPWGTIEENGVGKFDDFTDVALSALKELGVTHMWYTGVPHHGVITDYSDYGIGRDDPDVIKGRAGSPYAVKDYYNVNPDLATDPSKRLEEFEALIARTHANGMDVMIDIVPNHVARGYHGLSNPEGVVDFGANDDTSVEYARDNNFYYVVGESFQVPECPAEYLPLGGEEHSLLDGQFEENPAKWTGNGSRLAKPNFEDWYETVKINYGVKPDGSYDFDRLPDDYAEKDDQAHYEFWQGKEVPDSWEKFRDIAEYWIRKGVDGFRFDMAEMVPVEFWSYLNSFIKHENPDAFLLAEVYQPELYRDYIHLGKMDYLYDKVELYDTLKDIVRGEGSTMRIAEIQEGLADIEHHMLHFLENHDEQRLASPAFAGDPFKAMPLMVVSATISSSPTMVYFGQEVGEDGSEDGGFGDPTRTSIFDYVGVPALQRWVNGGKFDGGKLTEDERQLRAFYQRILNFSKNSDVLTGAYAEIHRFNLKQNFGYPEKVFSFVRWKADRNLFVVSSFDFDKIHPFNLIIPSDLIDELGYSEGVYSLVDALTGQVHDLVVKKGVGDVRVILEPGQSLILELDSQLRIHR